MMGQVLRILDPMCFKGITFGMCQFVVLCVSQ
jgi:hypothetical protein